MSGAKLIIEAGALLMSLALTACGPRTDSNVAYKTKSKSDIVKICEENTAMNVDIYRMRVNISKKQERTIVKECCKPVRQNAGKLSKKQRAWLWYNWKSNDDIGQTPNELAKLRKVSDALFGDLTSAQYLEAGAFKSGAAICAARSADRLR
ncbi:MAG: hypothetical protein AAGG45_05080 [Pseudomonadota bacterium]